MQLQRDALLERFYAREPGNDGRFVVGVRTTGIYCLPSCPARKPRPENVLVLVDEEDARSHGLRACKRCRPDLFYRGFDPDRELVEDLVARVRARPAAFPDARALGHEGGVGATKLTELFRRHLHATPAAFLLATRVEHAAEHLLAGRGSVLDAGLAAGFESPSAFHENFRRRTGLSPGEYRRLGDGREFVLRLPDGFRPEEIRAMVSRPGEGLAERADGRRLTKALMLAGRPARLELVLARKSVRCRVHTRRAPARATMAAAHRAAVRLLGLASDPGVFERRAVRRGHGRLVRGREGLRIPLTADAFEGLVWVIVGQQVNLAFATSSREVAIELAGADAGDGFRAHPTPAAVAGLDYADLTRRQYSRRKAEYLIDTSRAIAAGELDLEGLRRRSAVYVEETLGKVRGLGPWSIHYLLMRSFGLEDCVPLGDSGLNAALERYHELDGRPDAGTTLELMAPFAPHRSLATFHLWKTLGQTLGEPA